MSELNMAPQPSKQDIELTIHVLGIKNKAEADSIRDYWRDEVWVRRARRIGWCCLLFAGPLIGYLIAKWLR